VIIYNTKGVLNTLSGNRPHQGYVLRCGTYEFETITQLSTVDEIDEDDVDADTTSSSQLWLVLDEVVDPQNLGALLRSAYFMGNTKVLVCAKNSAPPSATVSAASAGALELSTVYSTANLPKILAAAEQQGYRIIGASATGVENSDIPIYDLQNLPSSSSSPSQSSSTVGKTVLVLGSEGRGLRHLVAKSCTEFVRIPGVGMNSRVNNDDGKSLAGVDSLNVSVTGGILLWQLLQQLQQKQNA
jgi:21S rRNA (GM2251-2'-O)-methyltransferase